MKLCSYCHKNPRAPGSCYCPNPRCAVTKREQNRRNMAAKRKRDREAERRETQRAYQHAEYMKRRARRLLREEEPPHRLTLVVTVTKWNLRTDEMYKVKL